MIEPIEKICSSCKETKELSEFSNLTQAKDGKCYSCRECQKVIRDKSYSKPSVREKSKKRHREYVLKNKERVLEVQRLYVKNNAFKVTLKNTKARAKKRGLEFSLKASDLVVPDVCPVLGIPLLHDHSGTRSFSPNSPSVDRLDSTKGYTSDNCRVISMRANVIKRDATLEELRAIVSYVERESR